MHAVEDLEKWRKSNRELNEHPDYPIESWVRAVDEGQTTLDYWDWMLSQANESDRRAHNAAAKPAEERTDQLMVEGNLFFFVNGSTDYGEVIKAAPYFVVPVIKGYDYSNSPMPLRVLTATNLCKFIEQSPRMTVGAIIYGYGAPTQEDANLILKRLCRYELESAECRHAAAENAAHARRLQWWNAGRTVLGLPVRLFTLLLVLLPILWFVFYLFLLIKPFLGGS